MIDYILASLMMFFIPGYTFVNALFPGRDELDEDLDMLYRIGFSIVMSLVFVILIGYMLGNIHFIVGYGSFYRSSYVWGSLSLMSIIFFLFGWYRGAYKLLGKIHPILDRPSPKVKMSRLGDFELIDDMEDLVRKQHELKNKLKESRESGDSEKDITEMEDELKSVTEKLKELEKKRAEQLEDVE